MLRQLKNKKYYDAQLTSKVFLINKVYGSDVLVEILCDDKGKIAILSATSAALDNANNKYQTRIKD